MVDIYDDSVVQFSAEEVVEYQLESLKYNRMRACGIRLLPSPAKVAGAGRRKPRRAVVARI